MKGYVHSLQSLGTVDGPGVRAVVFGEGCPLRCVYCHNPDTWQQKPVDLVDSAVLADRIIRLKPYIKNGGVTFSGGEPLVQPCFFQDLARLLKADNLHIALDTAGMTPNKDIKALLKSVDLVLLDIKFNTDLEYQKYCNGSLNDVLSFLTYLQSQKIKVWIRRVVLPGINDKESDFIGLRELLSGYADVIERVEFLPFRKLCAEKYEALNLRFALADTPEMSVARLARLEQLFKN